MTKLVARKEIEVRFSEVDSMNIVWHGNYAKYFEDSREEFGRKYNLGYLQIFDQGFYAPLVTLDFSFKRPLVYGDKAIVEASFQNTQAAKICFEYKIFSLKDNSIIATGKSVQVFLDKNYALVWSNPDFYLSWKKNNGLL